MKRTLWEGGVRGVGFITGAGLVRTGYASAELYASTDWYHTILSVAANGVGTPAREWRHWGDELLDGAEPPFALGDGMDVWHSVSTGAPSPRTEVIHEAHPKGEGTDDGNGQALRVGDLKVKLHRVGPSCETLPNALTKNPC